MHIFKRQTTVIQNLSTTHTKALTQYIFFFCFKFVDSCFSSPFYYKTQIMKLLLKYLKINNLNVLVAQLFIGILHCGIWRIFTSGTYLTT